MLTNTAFADINPQFIQQLCGCNKNEEQLDPNKAGNLEKLPERALLKKFKGYKQAKKKLKVFRIEAVLAGFKKAWQKRDYATIVAVAGIIPSNVLKEDPKRLMWYDQALTSVEGE